MRTVDLMIFTVIAVGLTVALNKEFHRRKRLRKKAEADRAAADAEAKESLDRKWREARRARCLWERKGHLVGDFSGTYDVYNREYQQLWNIELGAETVYVLRFPSAEVTSWKEYDERFHPTKHG